MMIVFFGLECIPFLYKDSYSMSDISWGLVIVFPIVYYGFVAWKDKQLEKEKNESTNQA